MSEASFEAIRPVLVSVDGHEAVRVALEHRAELFVAERPAPAGTEGRVGAAAAATAEALGQMTPEAVRFDLEWSALIDTGDRLPSVAAVLVGVDVAGAAMRYAGAASVVEEPAVAGAKAVLQALNRRLGVTGL